MTLEGVVRDELVYLWADMTTARRDAHGRCWAGQCENLAERIVTLSRLVGATSWEHIDVAIMRDGTYERVLREGGLEVPPIDWERVTEVERHIRRGVA